MRPHGSGKPHDLEVLVTPQLFCEVLDPLNVGRTLYEVQHILGLEFRKLMLYKN